LSIQTWQIGSKEPPTVCLCCGTRFDENEHKMRGPYNTNPYMYVCQTCWAKPYLFFPDKRTAPDGFQRFQETIIIKDIDIHQDDENMARAKTEILTTRSSAIFADAQGTKIPLSKLKLDPTNVRLRHLGKLKEAEVEQALWNEPGMDDWYRQIREEGGISEPVVIDSNYLTREGNERIVCLRRLSKEAHAGELPGVARDQFDSVPCRMVSPGASEKEIAIYLTRIHVKGSHKWKSLNKAIMIYELSTNHGLSYEELRKRLGISKKTVQTVKSAYEATLGYQNKHRDDAKWYYKYSYYHEIFKNEQLKNWAKQNGNLESFTDWIYTGKIPRGEDVRKLKKLILDQELFDEFKNANVTRARVILASFETLGSKSLDIISKATEVLRNFPLGELRGIVSDPVKMKVINEHYEEMTSFMKNAQSLKKA
jgi:hypothetical protein